MLARTPLRDMMIAWLEQQDPRTGYNWDSPFTCACGRFALTLEPGMQREWFQQWIDSPSHGEWQKLNRAAYGTGPRSWEFGSLLKRLRILVQLEERTC